jgi:hypothetical protein
LALGLPKETVVVRIELLDGGCTLWGNSEFSDFVIVADVGGVVVDTGDGGTGKGFVFRLFSRICG